jgi:1,4-dihydroxy-2-naphtoate prenyltransferase (EC 2.5.1.-)
MIFGESFARVEYAALVLGAYLLLPAIWWWSGTSPFVLLPWLSLPLALPLLRMVWTERGRVLNLALRGSARLHLVFGALLAIGLMV